MRIRRSCLAMVAAGLIGSVYCAAPTKAQGTSSYPYQAQPLVTDGVIVSLDSVHNRVVMKIMGGRTYALDTSQAEIILLNGRSSGTTADLSTGMRVHVFGQRLDSGVGEVAELRILPNLPLNPSRWPSATSKPTRAEAVGGDIQLRGTVDSVDTLRGAFVVRVQDHSRTIYLADETDLSGMQPRDTKRFPVKPGDRVTVAGRLQPDGAVLAGVVSWNQTISFSRNGLRSDRVLFGKISSRSNRFTSRDIKIKLTDEREIKIKVHRGLSIRRNGQAISVHDLHDGDDVRVMGSFEGTDFKANRIDVLRQDAWPLAPMRGL